MDISFAYMTCWLLCFVLLLLFLYYKSAMKMVEGFPYFPVFPKFVRDKVTGKIPKGVPFISYIIYSLINICIQFEKEGLFATYWVAPYLFIFSDEAIKFFSNDKLTVNKIPEYQLIGDFMGDGLLTSNGEKWKMHRKMINPAFHMGVLKNKVPAFNKHASALVKDMQQLAVNEPVDLLDALKCNYFNTLCESVFGVKHGEEHKSENLKLFSLVDSLFGLSCTRMVFPWLRLNFLLKFSPAGRKFQKQGQEFKNFIKKLINDMKSQVASNDSVNGDHINKSYSYILLNAHLNDPSFTLQDIQDEVGTMLVGGYDTVTYATLWCLFLLGHHPEIQETAFEEVQAVTGSYITYEDSCNLTYLEAVIMESLRLYPVPAFGRILSEDVQYNKYKVRKGTRIIFLSYIAHRNPDIYPDPENFEPERFLNGDSKRNNSFIPFSVGSRTCIGKKYAVIEMKIFLAYILRHFKIVSLDKPEDIHLLWAVVLTPAKRLLMRITPRDAKVDA